MKRRLLWVLAAAFVLAFAGCWTAEWWREHSEDQVILTASRRYGLDPALVKAVVWRESRFNPRARGKAGEIGLMQVRDAAAQEWAAAERIYPLPLTQLYNPLTNVLAGCWYLRKMLRRYAHTDNPVCYALADYNAGRGNVLKWTKASAATNSAQFMARITFPSTRKYIRAILHQWASYRPEFLTRARRRP